MVRSEKRFPTAGDPLNAMETPFWQMETLFRTLRNGFPEVFP